MDMTAHGSPPAAHPAPGCRCPVLGASEAGAKLRAAGSSRQRRHLKQQQQKQLKQHIQSSTCSLASQRLGDTCEVECGLRGRLRCCGDCPQCCRELNNNNNGPLTCCGSGRRAAVYRPSAAGGGQVVACSVCQLAERLAGGARIAGAAPEVGSPESPAHTGRPEAPTESGEKTVLGSGKSQNYSRVLSFRQRRLAMKLAPLGLRKRKPAPQPPLGGGGGGARWSGQRTSARPADSSDSGNTSGAELNSQPDDRAPRDNTLEAPRGPLAGAEPVAPVKLLDETEIFAIQHFVRSHKSSSYVCGCMANLYLTGTRLDRAGRWSKPDSDNWQLSKTGVPVLTFDSGLARNRPKRRLTISLAERGSGFVLWSDTIDHLTNYGPYTERRHGSELSSSEQQIDTFHLMYLSTNHRLMAGLSFDDATCARLFLKQVELISSDPANIALTGPKVGAARRLRGANGLVAGLFACGSRARQQQQKQQQRTCSGSGARNSATGASSALTPAALKPADHSWSTLRLACQLRMGRRRHQRQATSSAAPVGLASATQLGPGGAQQAELLGPRSLAQQAAAGPAHRRAPRKCDISAPCLFQHVTRVDAHCLEGLHSGSLVAAPATSVPERASCPPTCARGTGSPVHNSGRPPNCSDAASSISSSSSCYSTVGSQHASSSGEWTAPPAAASNRPKPPARRTSTSTSTTERQHQQPPPPPPPPPPPEPAPPPESTSRPQRDRKQPEAARSCAKIQAIIRELQAQSLSELVEAKRRLMADIAQRSGAMSHL